MLYIIFIHTLFTFLLPLMVLMDCPIARDRKSPLQTCALIEIWVQTLKSLPY